MDPVEVQFTEDGYPLRIRRAGRVWQVAVEPICHFERIRWWEDTSNCIRKGTGFKIDYAVWRVQVRLGSNPRSDLLTWDLIEDRQGGPWTARDVDSSLSVDVTDPADEPAQPALL